MKRIYLVRHCKAKGQEASAQLTEEGFIQAEELVDLFSNKQIDFIVSSPYERAVTTIRPLSKKLNLEIHIDDRLSERVLSSENVADWIDRLKESFADLDIKLPGGESSREAMNRGAAAINELLERKEASIVAVTHGNLMSLILKSFDDRFGFDDWKALSNPDVYELTFTDKSREVIINRLWK
ncbi:histidine phosphatase family protein [Paenibacillus alkalitolerans]|uniref:histidine phosphatase family protein n=1 Tax=Paenibacillus alkalitolerans TaxID=2799335 RepID=UPI0018F4FEA1|nr:histidine phosphatase family protein [Paenibacillus alkalitolerans]